MTTKTEPTNFSYGNQRLIEYGINAMEKGLVPDYFIRKGIQSLLRQRLSEEASNNPESSSENFHRFLKELKSSRIAINTDDANEQHYEVDSRFFELALGKRKKYSSCYYHDNESLDQAEIHMLDLYLQRGEFEDGQDILELGCGWGSLSLYLAEKYPNSKITSISNSNSQRKHIESLAQQKNLSNLKIITQDINNFEIDNKFDRVVSIEMFEHIRNYQGLFHKISSWLKPQGKLFIHIFCHRFLMYPFETQGSDNWMGKYFFSGGQMPAADTFLFFQDDLKIQRRWINNGQHYEKTSNHWLQNMDQNKKEILNLFKECYGQEYKIWFQRWRIFFMACAELFGYNKGNEWLVGHYLFSK